MRSGGQRARRVGRNARAGQRSCAERRRAVLEGDGAGRRTIGAAHRRRERHRCAIGARVGAGHQRCRCRILVHGLRQRGRRAGGEIRVATIDRGDRMAAAGQRRGRQGGDAGTVKCSGTKARCAVHEGNSARRRACATAHRRGEGRRAAITRRIDRRRYRRCRRCLVDHLRQCRGRGCAIERIAAIDHCDRMAGDR